MSQKDIRPRGTGIFLTSVRVQNKGYVSLILCSESQTRTHSGKEPLDLRGPHVHTEKIGRPF